MSNSSDAKTLRLHFWNTCPQYMPSKALANSKINLGPENVTFVVPQIIVLSPSQNVK